MTYAESRLWRHARRTFPPDVAKVIASMSIDCCEGRWKEPERYQNNDINTCFAWAEMQSRLGRVGIDLIMSELHIALQRKHGYGYRLEMLAPREQMSLFPDEEVSV